MDEITFQVLRDDDSGMLVASWDAPAGFGGISTQGRDLSDLQVQIIEAVTVHFDDKPPQSIRVDVFTQNISRGA